MPIKGESGWGRSEKGAFLLEHLRSEEWLLEQTAPDEGSHGLRIRGDSSGRCTCRLLMILPLPVLACSTAGFRCLCSVIWSCRLSLNSIYYFRCHLFSFLSKSGAAKFSAFLFFVLFFVICVVSCRSFDASLFIFFTLWLKLVVGFDDSIVKHSLVTQSG